MRSATYVKRLECEPETVSDFLADLGNDPTWRREVMSTQLVSGSPRQPGASYREALTWEGLKAEASLALTEYTAGSRLVIVASDPGYESVSVWGFTADGGGTEATLTLSLETKGPLLLIEPFMWAMASRWLERDIESLEDCVGSAAKK